MPVAPTVQYASFEQMFANAYLVDIRDRVAFRSSRRYVIQDQQNVFDIYQCVRCFIRGVLGPHEISHRDAI